jgi:hypothetical protein
MVQLKSIMDARDSEVAHLNDQLDRKNIHVCTRAQSCSRAVVQHTSIHLTVVEPPTRVLWLYCRSAT